LITEPKIEFRDEQPYMAIRTQAALKDLRKVIPQLLTEVFAWLDKEGAPPAGAPFIRFNVIDMAAKSDIELGVPVPGALAGDGRVQAGALPAGRYASLIYTGNGIKANAALLDWAAKNGLVFDHWDTENGDAFRGRYESFLTGPDEEPDRSKWQTEVSIRLVD